jgi:hypothetical protein
MTMIDDRQDRLYNRGKLGKLGKFGKLNETKKKKGKRDVSKVKTMYLFAVKYFDNKFVVLAVEIFVPSFPLLHCISLTLKTIHN